MTRGAYRNSAFDLDEAQLVDDDAALTRHWRAVTPDDDDAAVTREWPALAVSDDDLANADDGAVTSHNERELPSCTGARQ